MADGGIPQDANDFNKASETTLSDIIQEIVRKFHQISVDESEIVELYVKNKNQSQVIRMLDSGNEQIFEELINEKDILQELDENECQNQLCQLLSASENSSKNCETFNIASTKDSQNVQRWRTESELPGPSRKRCNKRCDNIGFASCSKKSADSDFDKNDLIVKIADNRFVLDKLKDGRLFCVSISYTPPADSKSDPDNCFGVTFAYYELDPTTKLYKLSPYPNNISWEETGLQLDPNQLKMLWKLDPYIRFQITCMKENIATCKRGQFSAAVKLFCKKGLGRGTFGVVFEAYDPERLKYVALKRQKLNLLSIKEAAAVFQYQFSKHCPRLYENLVVGERVYTSFQLLGHDLWTLQNKTKYKRFTVQCATRLMRQSCEAVRDFQSLGLVHCDISMGNLIMGGPEHRDILFLVDYGFCRPSDVKPHKLPGEFLGTTRYASPFAHEVRRVFLSPRDDIYSLFYCYTEMVLGKLPWQKIENVPGLSREEIEKWVGIMKSRYPVEDLCKLLPLGMDTFVQHLTSLGPKDRSDFDLMDDCLKIVLRRLNLEENAPFDWQLSSTEDLLYWPKTD